MLRFWGWRFLVAAAFAWPMAARAVPLNVQIDEVLAGANGDSGIQFIEIKMQDAAQNLWGPQGMESVGRVKLTFHDATGAQTGEFVFTANAPVGVVDLINGGYSVLIATADFAAEAGMPTPDIVIPRNVMAVDGKVCFRANPANPNAPEVNLCLSYGNFVGATESDSGANPAGAPTVVAPITNAVSLKRTTNFGNYGGAGHFNADFAAATPAPRNSGGATGAITVKTLQQQGEVLFTDETFNGNGRTCHTCHRPDDEFGLSPAKIATLPGSDPLFVAEFIPALATLENPCMMRSARGLILENIDGFANPHVFREPPHLLNIALTAPYGLSGEFANLQLFSTGAVQQHFPKTMARNADPTMGPLDFRLPTLIERQAMEAFMNSIVLPADGDFDLDRMINAEIARGGDAAAIQRGRNLFTGSAKCFKCHSGPVLAETDVTLGGGFQSFNTGVVNLPINSFLDACLGFQPLPQEDGGNRAFSTPPLIGVSRTAPYFHDNSVQVLRTAVEFYNGTEFNNSPGASAVGGISMTPQDIDDITAFLEALIEPTVVDCNSNGTDDIVDLNNGSALDCNGNAKPDSCELAGNDCNTNTTPDECDERPVYASTPSGFATGDGPFFITDADVDGDGDRDLLAPSWNGANLAVMLNNGTGVFAAPQTFATGNFPRTCAVGDVNNDGKPDVVVGNNSSAFLSVFLGKGLLMGVWQGLDPAISVSTGFNGARTVALGQLDGDLFPDIAVANTSTHSLQILINRGDGGGGAWLGFNAPVNYPCSPGLGPRSITIGKFSFDARDDVAVGLRLTDEVGVFINNGNGTFSPIVRYPVERAPSGLVAADFDGDTLDDIAVSCNDTDTVMTLLNDGAGTFYNVVQSFVVGNYPFGAAPRNVDAADIDGDTLPDLVLANNESANVSVMLNVGFGVFFPLVNFTTPTLPEWCTAGDFNGDGRPDIATAHFGSDSGVVLFNTTPLYGGDCNQNANPDACDISAAISKDRNINGVPDSCENLGDVDRDGTTNAADLSYFVNVLLGYDTTPLHVTWSDINGDSTPNGSDIAPYVDIYVGGV